MLLTCCPDVAQALATVRYLCAISKVGRSLIPMPGTQLATAEDRRREEDLPIFVWPPMWPMENAPVQPAMATLTLDAQLRENAQASCPVLPNDHNDHIERQTRRSRPFVRIKIHLEQVMGKKKASSRRAPKQLESDVTAVSKVQRCRPPIFAPVNRATSG
jgi:hypothetical protein